MEPDGAVIRAAGNALDGRSNRIVYSGAIPGDGGLFLDARLALTARESMVFGDAFEPATGRPDALLPGPHGLFAWYGWWSDKVPDGKISDVHDAACDGAPCPADEFVWRGVGNGDLNVGGVLFHIPKTTVIPVSGGGNPEWASEASWTLKHMVDFTSRERQEQGWMTQEAIASADGSLLVTIQTLVVLGAPKLAQPGHFFYDLEDAAGLHDVDRYESLNSDVESLYRGSLSTPIPTSGDVQRLAQGAIDAVRSTTSPIVEDVVDAAAPVLGIVAPVLSLLDDVGSGAPQLIYLAQLPANSTEAAFRTFTTPYAKEPNTGEDDYEGRAFFGGVGDLQGSNNAYDAYASGYHLYVDVLPRARACAGLESPASTRNCPGVSTLGGVSGNQGHTDNLDPAGATVGTGARSPGLLLSFTAEPAAWKDSNRDTHLGAVCDPDSANFDAPRNTCSRETPYYPYPWPHKAGERVTVCQVAAMRDTTFKLSPIGGAWPDVLVLRNTQRLEVAQIEGPRSDAEPITLRWSDTCMNLGSILESRDAVLFPKGSTVSVRVEASASIAILRDAALGIDITNERVVDVDFLVAAL